MRFLYVLLIIILSFFLINAYEPDFCRSCGRDTICLSYCETYLIEDLPTSSTQDSLTYPISLEVDHSFSSSSGMMYMALLSPFGEIIETVSESIGMKAKDAFEENSVYTELDLPVVSGCSYGPGDYNLLIHTNPVGSGTTSFTAESNLYSCSSLFDLLNSVQVPLSWEKNDSIEIYCSLFDSQQDDLLGVFQGNFFNNIYSGCIIKNSKLNSTLIAGMLYGSIIEQGYGSDRLSTVEDVEIFLGSDASCSNIEGGFSCIIDEVTYTFSYDSSLNIFHLSTIPISDLKVALSTLVSYNERIENSLTQSLLLKKFDEEKMIVGYDIPTDFLRENPSLVLEVTQKDSSFNFDLQYIVHYQNFQNMSSYCYNTLRSQSQSTSSLEYIDIIDEDQNRIYFEDFYSIVCHNQFIFLKDTNLFKNLVFDTVLGEIGYEKSYVSIFDTYPVSDNVVITPGDNQIFDDEEEDFLIGLDPEGELIR